MVLSRSRSSSWLGSRVFMPCATQASLAFWVISVGTILSTSLVSSDVDATPITPTESMSLRWYSSLAPPPRTWRKSALIVDSNSGANSNRFLTSRRRWRTATSAARLFCRRSARAGADTAPDAANTAITARTEGVFMSCPSAEGGVLERRRDPEAHADLEHQVVDQRALGVILGQGGGREHRLRAVPGLEMVVEDVVADAEVDGDPLGDEEPHRRADVGHDQEVGEPGELGVARDHLALAGADAGGEERLPGHQLVIEDGELAVDRHVVEVERGAPLVLVERGQPAGLARDQVVRLLERVREVLTLDADREHVGQVVG